MLSGSIGLTGTIGTIPKIGSSERLGRGNTRAHDWRKLLELGELYPEFPFFYGKNYGDFVVFSLRNRGENVEILCAIHSYGENVEKLWNFDGDFMCI